MEKNPQDLYARFLDVQRTYAGRNATFDSLATFFDGQHWDETVEAGQEDMRLVLNYGRRAVLWHVAYTTKYSPRVDVPLRKTPDLGAVRRERFLRAALASPSFRDTYRRIELSAAKYGVGVLETLFLKSTEKRITQLPFVFRAINPRQFYPVYKTFDSPDNFLYVFLFDEDRLVEDIEREYGVSLEATGGTPGTLLGTADLLEYWDEEDYILLALTKRIVLNRMGKEEGEEIAPIVLRHEKNPLGRIPFFVLPNIVVEPFADPTSGGGVSEISLVQEVNRQINLLVSLAQEEIAGRIHPPLVYKTDDPRQDPSAIRLGAGRTIPIGADEALDVLRWEGIPATVAEQRNALMQALRDLSGLPYTAFGAAGDTSGVGMRLSYATLELSEALKFPEREGFLRRIFSFLLQTLDQQLTAGQSVALGAGKGTTPIATDVLRKADIDGNYECDVQAQSAVPRDRIEWEQHVIYLYKTGVISQRTALEMLEGIPDPDLELERIRQENQDKELHPEKAALIGKGEESPEQAQGRFNAAPPVPTLPSTPTQRNAPFLERGEVPNIRQLGGMQPGRGPGVNPGPPLEEAG